MKQVTTTVRTTKTLREILWNELEALRDGTSLPSRTNAVSRSAAQIILTAKLELDAAKMKFLTTRGMIPTEIEPVAL
jgi:hypothetical protein